MKKILLIEDNKDILENTAEILELANYTVLTAPNGKEGVDQALKHMPDLIVCDIMMPVLDGYGVLHLLQKHDKTRNIPFIFLTAKAEMSDIRKGMESGADDYIIKPFSASDLLNAIESRLKKAELLHQSPPQDLDDFVAQYQGLNNNEIMKRFTADRNTIQFKKKQLVYREGNHPASLFYIRKGKVKTYKTNEEGKELAVDLFSENDFLGYTTLLEGSTYKESAIAMTDIELAIIPKNDFEELIKNNWDIAQRFIKMVAKNIAEKEEQLLGLAYNSLRKKVADALIKLKKKYSNNNEGFQIDISRENLATIAGTATESLIRTLGDFREEKLIEINEGYITIVNEDKLKNMIN